MRGLGTRRAQEVRRGGAATDPMATSEQRASPKHCLLSPKRQNQKVQAKTSKSVSERHRMDLVREKRGDGPMCRALFCRQRIKTNNDGKKKKKKLVGTRPFTSRSVQNQSASNCTLARDMSISLFQFSMCVSSLKKGKESHL